MAYARQRLTVWNFRKAKKESQNKLFFINKMSKGTIWVNNVPFTYNAELAYHGEAALNTSIDDIIDDYEKRHTSKRRVIVIKKRSKPR